MSGFNAYAGRRRRNKKVVQAMEQVEVNQLQEDTSLMCGICWDKEDDLSKKNKAVARLGCHRAHQFHYHCLQKWVNISKTCPSCSASIPEKKIRAIKRNANASVEENVDEPIHEHKCAWTALSIAAVVMFSGIITRVCSSDLDCFPIA